MLSFLYVYSDHSILECYDLFSGVELSMRSFFVISNMSLSSSKPFRISLSDMIEKVRSYSACWGGQLIVEDHCEFEESTDREGQEHGEDFDVID